ncbi:MAG: efflux RND transporter periplasmic adaptor subunit [Gallionella sp.]
MNRRFLPLSIIVVIAAILVALVEWRAAGNAGTAKGKRPDKPLAVEIAPVRVQTMPISLQVVGQVQSEHSVQIRPQIGGMLRRVFFKEGQAVSKGQQLFRIDPNQYETALSAARAEWEYAKQQAQRLAPLAGKEYVTTQEYDNARAAVDKAQAALKQAEINFSYTDIRSPISGRTGSLGAKPGNLVAPGDATALVVINQMQPILVQYSIPQQSLSALRRYQADRSVRIFVTNEDGSGDLGSGELVFVDNAVNTETGTVMLKARVGNAQEKLWPGQYVGVRTQLALQSGALVVPQTAVQTGQSGNFVYVVEQGAAAIREVQVDRQVHDSAVISSGLKAGESVVTRAPRNLRPGVKLVPVDAAESPKSGKPASAPTKPVSPQ